MADQPHDGNRSRRRTICAEPAELDHRIRILAVRALPVREEIDASAQSVRTQSPDERLGEVEITPQRGTVLVGRADLDRDLRAGDFGKGELDELLDSSCVGVLVEHHLSKAVDECCSFLLVRQETIQLGTK